MKKIVVVAIFILTNIIAMNSCFGFQTNDEENNENGIFPPEQTAEYEMPLSVPFIRLIANPAEYHGKKIRVKGVGNLSFEGTAVYLCIDNWYYLSRDAIWVNIPQEVVDNKLWYYINGERISEEEAQKYNGKYVLIEGTFDMYDVGHRGLFSGGIYDVTRFDDFSDINRGTGE